ncbi:uncharacterized protein V1518DRAFT_425699 [Limtongia smithiae]|uniref:uncharacterized protein n=1 Tax=Limtongia smithiae TaxID=1125753 RepID=UPI0034CEC45C
MRSQFRPKHQRLILQCYPGGRSQEKHPNSSELQYLLYYVSTRRTKLQKVGLFLDRKNKRDVWRGRAGNVQVTLDIVKALMGRCPADLNVFAASVISIFSTVLSSNDLALCQYTEAAFQTFCQNHDGGLLADDPEFVQNFSNLLHLYMNVRNRNSPANDNTWSLISLRAAKSIASSEAISCSAAQLNEQIQIVSPVILEQLYTPVGDNLTELNNYASAVEQASDSSNRTPRTSTGTVPLHLTLDAADNSNSQREADVLALQALRKLLETSNDGSSSQIRYTSMAVIHFIIGHPKNTSWATSIIDLMAQWTPVQLRFVIMRSLLEVLYSMPLARLDTQLIVTKLISSLLSSSVNLAGLSVLDVLHVLFSQIIKLLDAPPDSNSDDALKGVLLENLAQAIGDLATHTYYADQVRDMTTEILVRIRPPAELIVSQHAQQDGQATDIVDAADPQPPSTVNSYANLEKYILSSASQKNFARLPAMIIGLKVVREIMMVANTLENGVKRNIVPIQAWNNTEWALTAPEVTIRTVYIDAILAYLNLEIGNDQMLAFKVTPHSNAHSGFVAKLHMALYDYCLQETNAMQDFMAINTILLTIVKRLGLYGILRGLPMMLQLQSVIHSGITNGLNSSRTTVKILGRNLTVLDSMILTYYAACARELGLAELETRVKKEINRRVAEKWFSEYISDPPKPVPFLAGGGLPTALATGEKAPQLSTDASILTTNGRRQSRSVGKTTGTTVSSLKKLHLADDDSDDSDDERHKTVDTNGYETDSAEQLPAGSISTDENAPVNRELIKAYIDTALTQIPAANIRRELTSVWTKELVLREDPDSTQSSIGDVTPLIFHVVPNNRGRHFKPIRAAW